MITSTWREIGKIMNKLNVSINKKSKKKSKKKEEPKLIIEVNDEK